MPEELPNSEAEEREARLASFSTRNQKLRNEPNSSQRRQRWPRRIIHLLLVPFLCLGFGFGGGWIGAKVYNESSDFVSTKAQQKYVSSESELIADIAGNVGSSVVSVNVESEVSVRDLFGVPSSSNQESAGTGFIVDSSGVIMTNRHVVPTGTSKVTITLSDGTDYEADVIGRTSSGNSLDLAFLKIKDLKGKQLKAVTLGDSSKAKVGDHVVAIGNALGEFQNTVTSGIISGFGRDVTASDSTGQGAEDLTDLIQTDAAINSGNSGGPLVNINGEVIGINTAVAAGGAQNIGFAIPINDTKGLLSSVLQTGQLKQPYLGVRYVNLTNDLAELNSLSVKRGAFIVEAAEGEPSVIPGSPAEKAGLKPKDVITKVNNVAIDDKTSLTSALNKHRVGDKVTLTLVRDGKTTTLQATLGEAPKD